MGGVSNMLTQARDHPCVWAVLLPNLVDEVLRKVLYLRHTEMDSKKTTYT
jgi:hypothetical protein